jgi:hypothetical protein
MFLGRLKAIDDDRKDITGKDDPDVNFTYVPGSPLKNDIICVPHFEHLGPLSIDKDLGIKLPLLKYYEDELIKKEEEKKKDSEDDDSDAEEEKKEKEIKGKPKIAAKVKTKKLSNLERLQQRFNPTPPKPAPEEVKPSDDSPDVLANLPFLAISTGQPTKQKKKKKMKVEPKPEYRFKMRFLPTQNLLKHRPDFSIKEIPDYAIPSDLPESIIEYERQFVEYTQSPKLKSKPNPNVNINYNSNINKPAINNFTSPFGVDHAGTWKYIINDDNDGGYKSNFNGTPTTPRTPTWKRVPEPLYEAPVVIPKVNPTTGLLYIDNSHFPSPIKSNVPGSFINSRYKTPLAIKKSPRVNSPLLIENDAPDSSAYSTPIKSNPNSNTELDFISPNTTKLTQLTIHTNDTAPNNQSINLFIPSKTPSNIDLNPYKDPFLYTSPSAIKLPDDSFTLLDHLPDIAIRLIICEYLTLVDITRLDTAVSKRKRLVLKKNLNKHQLSITTDEKYIYNPLMLMWLAYKGIYIDIETLNIGEQIGKSVGRSWSHKHTIYRYNFIPIQGNKLKYLNLTGCMSLTDKPLVEILSLSPNLHELDISGCLKITDLSLNQIAISNRDIKSIKCGIILLKYDHPPTITDESIINIANNCIHLQHLDLSCDKNKLTTESIFVIAEKCQDLRELILPLHFTVVDEISLKKIANHHCVRCGSQPYTIRRGFDHFYEMSGAKQRIVCRCNIITKSLILKKENRRR